jgi:hypothetical protein
MLLTSQNPFGEFEPFTTLCPLTSRSMMEVMSPPERNGDG